MVNISVCGEESTPVAVSTGIVLSYPVDGKEEAMSFWEARLGRDDRRRTGRACLDRRCR